MDNPSHLVYPRVRRVLLATQITRAEADRIIRLVETRVRVKEA